MGGSGLGSPAGAFIVELGAALCLQAGVALLLLQVSRGGRVGVSPGRLVRQGGVVVGGVQEDHGTLRAPPACQPLARYGVVIVKISRGRGPRSSCCRVLLRAGCRCARERTGNDAISKERPQALNFKIPTVTQLVSRAPKL
jgi:hypothetical protein